MHRCARFWKQRLLVGLNKARLVDLSQLSERDCETRESRSVGQRIADEAITLVRDNGRVIPLQASSSFSGNYRSLRFRINP
jgi:hypothetical protein